MIIYEFPKDGPQDFYSASGFTDMQVVNGVLRLDDEPGEALMGLINQFEGKLVAEEKPKAKTSKTKEDKEEDS